jgi:Carboxypeptidase regulatory-like domain/TonB dependent receptor-like, beta-barrel
MRRILILSLLVLLAALPLAAQSLTGTVTGTVKDEQGGVLPGVTVTLAGKTGTRTAVTDAEGIYRFAALDPGTYSVTASLSGFRPKRQENVIVSVTRSAEINLVLAVGGVAETVDVVGESPIVDATSSATDNALSQDMLFNLPIRPTNAAVDMLNYLPGINNGSAYGTNSDYANGLLIDGVDTRDPDAGSSWVFFNYNLMEEVQVGGLGANAEYGSFTGAVVNTITKSGGNRYTGLFDAYWTKKSFWGDNIKSDYVAKNPSLGDPAVVNKRLDLTGQIGGPLIKDKLFFFVAAQRYEQEDNPSGPLTLHTEVSPRFNAKLTWQPGPNDNLMASFQWDYYNQTGRTSIGSNLDQDSNTVNQDSPEAVWNLQWRHLFSTRTFAEVKYSGWWGYYYLDPKVQTPLSYDATSGQYSGGAWFFYYADRLRNQVNALISHHAEAFGKHDLKFGVEIERSKVHSQYGYNQGIYYYDLTESYPKGQYLAYDYGYDAEGHNQRESVYAQDSWKPTNRLTINAGVRVDFVRGRSPALDKTVYSNTNWAPRLGFAFDLTGNGKTVLKGHYGQYYEAILFDQYARALPGWRDYVGYSYDPSGSKCGPLGNCFTESSRLLYPVYGIDPNMKHPRVDEWTAGIERELTKDVRVSLTGIWRQDKNIQASVYPDARWSPTTVTNGLTDRPLTVYNWANRSASETTPILTNVGGFVYRDPSGNTLGTARAERKYEGVMFVLDKRFTNRWQGRVSYVWSKTKSSINNTGSNTYGQTSAFETPTNALVNNYGYPVNDRTHEIKVYGTWQIPKIEVGLNGYWSYLTGRTWTPYQRYSSKQIVYPRSAGRQPWLEPFGDRRLDNESYLDLRLEKIFKVGAGTDRIAVYADVQNLFNAGTILAVQSRNPSISIANEDVNFSSPTSIVEPRRWLLGARWSF